MFAVVTQFVLCVFTKRKIGKIFKCAPCKMLSTMEIVKLFFIILVQLFAWPESLSAKPNDIYTSPHCFQQHTLLRISLFSLTLYRSPSRYCCLPIALISAQSLFLRFLSLRARGFKGRSSVLLCVAKLCLQFSLTGFEIHSRVSISRHHDFNSFVFFIRNEFASPTFNHSINIHSLRNFFLMSSLLEMSLLVLFLGCLFLLSS